MTLSREPPARDEGQALIEVIVWTLLFCFVFAGSARLFLAECESYRRLLSRSPEVVLPR